MHAGSNSPSHFYCRPKLRQPQAMHLQFSTDNTLPSFLYLTSAYSVLLFHSGKPSFPSQAD